MLNYVSKPKLRIIYDKGWYERHKLKAIQDHTGDVPLDSLCPLCKIPDSLRHWTSECQDTALTICRNEVLNSIPKPEGDKPAHIFTREISLIIPQLLIDTTEPERVWTSNLITRLPQLLFSRLPSTLRKIGVTAARSGLRTSLETLAKGCHKLWVARHAAMKEDKVQHQVPGDASDGDSVDSISSLMDEDAVEMSQTISVDDKLTLTQEDNEGSELHEDMHVESVDTTAAQHTIRDPNKQRINEDYIQKKRQRKNTYLQ